MTTNKEWFDDLTNKYEQLGYWEPLTLGDQLKLWAEKYRYNIALVESNTTLTYEELDFKVDTLASGFFQMGIQKGDHVVIQLPNSISFVITCFALFRIGALPILALPSYRESELDGIFHLTKPVAYIIPDRFLGFDYTKFADKLVQKHPSVQNVIVDGEDANGTSMRFTDINKPPVNLQPPSYRDTALLLLSGGTTGTPKLIPRTHADYAYNAKTAASRCQLNSRSVYLAVLPISHNFPLCCPGIFGTLSVGGKVVLSKTTSCDEAFPLIERENVTVTALVPAIVKLWLEVLEWDKSSDISSLQLIQVGGSMLDKDLSQRIMPEMKCKLQQIFGMAEGLICCTSLDDHEDVIHNTQGRPMSAGDEIRIVDEDGNDVTQGEYGELIVRGPYTIRGYYRDPEQTRQSFTANGFYHSGDRARITAEGNIQIGGRIKEQINRAGEKINPLEVESHLCAHPDVQDAVLIGIPDEKLGERSCAYLISNHNQIHLMDIYSFLKSRGLACYKMPDQIEFVDFWPLTSVGKIDKSKLRRMAMESNRQQDAPGAFFEESLDFTGDVYVAAGQVIEFNLFEDYLLYENEEELSLGMGVHTMISVDPEFTILQTEEHTQRFENKILSKTLEKTFSFVPLQKWRAYGMAFFGLSRYIHKQPLLGEDECLLKLFIPKVEVRFTKESILIRSPEKKYVEEMVKLLKKLPDEELVKNREHHLAHRANQTKQLFPEINMYESEKYMNIVKEAVQDIRQRQYQKVVLSRKIPLDREIDMTASYIAGRRVNSPERSFLFSLDGLQAAGFSPETLVEVDSQGRISTFPLAGTRARGCSAEEEQRLQNELMNDSKEVAEHALSVKLSFQEMKQVCDFETISINDFMRVVKRGTVQHVASRLKGQLKQGCNSWDAFQALFPAVTASGIPKKESIEAIGRLESHPRNLYSGCVMTFDSDGSMDAALALRTIFQKDRNAWLHVGAGIVEMSNPSRELEETCEKLSSFSEQLVCSQHEKTKI
ncbi:salicylate synthase [Bacillus paramycoides]|uniref:salicylate synthase n=1 Tax=Bacillus paramycoides TaxID=2026194 RepID=UPI004059B1F4